MKFETQSLYHIAVIKEMLAKAENTSHSLSYSKQFNDEDNEIMSEDDRTIAISQLIAQLKVETY